MKWIYCIPAGALLLACLGFQASAANKPTPKPAAPTFKKVEDILSANCTRCHGDERARGGIDLTTYAAVMKGGDDGPILKKGAPKHSVLIQALRGLNGVRQMPPRHDPLPEDQIALIEAWIKSGAKP